MVRLLGEEGNPTSRAHAWASELGGNSAFTKTLRLWWQVRGRPRQPLRGLAAAPQDR